jgi:hypothetical protein
VSDIPEFITWYNILVIKHIKTYYAVYNLAGRRRKFEHDTITARD